MALKQSIHSVPPMRFRLAQIHRDECWPPRQKRRKCRSAGILSCLETSEVQMTPTFSPTRLSRRLTVQRGVSFALVLVTGLFNHGWLEASAEEEAGRKRGIGRYIKRKQLEPLETYVPAVVAAKTQLTLAGAKMKDDLQGARDLLRSGPFDGLRDNIRALGEYAAKENPQDSSRLPDDFFSAVQKFDFTLFQAKREGKEAGAAADEALKQTTLAIDRLLATVPSDVIQFSEAIVEQIQSSEINQPSLPNQPDQRQNQLLQLVPS